MAKVTRGPRSFSQLLQSKAMSVLQILTVGLLWKKTGESSQSVHSSWSVTHIQSAESPPTCSDDKVTLRLDIAHLLPKPAVIFFSFLYNTTCQMHCYNLFGKPRGFFLLLLDFMLDARIITCVCFWFMLPDQFIKHANVLKPCALLLRWLWKVSLTASSTQTATGIAEKMERHK